MTTPDPLTPQYGTAAGEPGSLQYDMWLMKIAQINDAQQMNTQTVHQMAAQGIAGADGIALMTRLNVFIDTLFGDLQGNPGVMAADPLFRLDLELRIQQHIAQVLAVGRAQAEAALRQAGREVVRGSGLIVPGKN